MKMRLKRLANCWVLSQHDLIMKQMMEEQIIFGRWVITLIGLLNVKTKRLPTRFQKAIAISLLVLSDGLKKFMDQSMLYYLLLFIDLKKLIIWPLK